ncbi:hypothetical protein GCM10027168_63080 [Streptomyces capparidis]
MIQTRDPSPPGGRPARTPHHDRLYLLTLPVWELKAVWEVLNAVRRARDGKPGTEELRDLVELCGASFLPAPGDRADAGHPSSEHPGTALVMRAPPDGVGREAYRHLTAA